MKILTKSMTVLLVEQCFEEPYSTGLQKHGIIWYDEFITSRGQLLNQQRKHSCRKNCWL